MTRKRVNNQPKKKQKSNIFKEKTTIYFIVILVILITSFGIIALLQSEPNNTNQQEVIQTGGQWLFAMDTPSKNIGYYQEYNTGYIPTLVIIDINGDIIHKSAGVHTKEDLLNHIEHAKDPGSVSTLGKAPDFTLTTFDGNDFTLSDYKGTPIILDLMAVRCPPCHEQMPELYKLKNELGNGVIILSIDIDGVSGGETQQDVRDAFGEYIYEGK